MKKIILLAFFSACLTAYPLMAKADYTYANAEGEYVVTLPDAPLGETIWAQDRHVPLIDSPPKYGSVGEYAILTRVDPDTDDIFDVKITFVKADHEFLEKLTEQRIKDELSQIFPDSHLQNVKFSYSAGSGALKWGTYSGFSVNQKNEVIFNIAHYLVGQQSVMTVKVSYSVENKLFSQYYNTLTKSIAYTGL
jgi:hypothetical protein